jgi:hypothetical protein
MDFQGPDRYIEREVDRMSSQRPSPTAVYIRQLAAQHHVAYTSTRGDEMAAHYSRLADNEPIAFDEVEQMLIALQRAGYLERSEVVRLQASYLNESKP